LKFFFPDSHDLVDPDFDFVSERRRYSGSRQQSYCYAHEVLSDPPYDGMLLSKAVIDPLDNIKSPRYKFTQVQRLKRLGAREFLRLDRPGLKKRIETMGDCGSFSYIKEPEPPFTISNIIEFYFDCQFDYGISPDHVIFGFQEDDSEKPMLDEWRRRFEITLDRAEEFLKEHHRQKLSFTPIGAAQGWSPSSYADAVRKLEAMGYDYIALGGMVPLKTNELLKSLEAVAKVKKSSTRIHLLGIARLERIDEFRRFGVTSIDSTSPLKKAFMDDKENYHTSSKNYIAVRVPQVGGNQQLDKLILAGIVDSKLARENELACMRVLMDYDQGKIGIEPVLDNLRSYEAIWHGEKDDSDRYRETLEEMPWKNCPCSICKRLGIHVVLFRGAERNRSRGFHNLYTLRNRLHQASQK
jgi:hypothetical protein